MGASDSIRLKLHRTEQFWFTESREMTSTRMNCMYEPGRGSHTHACDTLPPPACLRASRGMPHRREGKL